MKGGLVVVGAMLLSTLGIFASDALQGIDSGAGLAGVGRAGVCVKGMVPLTVDGRVMCVDLYEASAGSKCPHTSPENTLQTEENAITKDCYPESTAGKKPWSFVSLSQAQRICAVSGKRLPTSREWYHIALGTNASECVVENGEPQPTGKAGCTSSVGAFDAVGNVWEWVDEQVIGNSYDGRTLPEEGYVTSVDAGGVALTSGKSADELYGKDYIWTKNDGVFGMIRGGYYGSGNDAGLYTVNASVPTNFATQGVGFRCVQDVF